MKQKFYILFFLFCFFPLFAFDPKSVMSKSCASGAGNCGFIPTSTTNQRSVPVLEIKTRNNLPSSVDLEKEMPPVGNQGQQSSCVAWATAYAAKSFHENDERKWGYDSPVTGGKGTKIFSPAYIYNQINGGRDEGSVMENALDLMVRKGAATWDAMPYTDRDYLKQPSNSVHQEASKFKASSYRRINASDLNTIKSELAAKRPVIFGMGVDEGFYQLKKEVYDQTRGNNYGGHAMTLVGYDDSKKSPRGHVGAFKIINSWGTGWGENGYGWISYKEWIRQNPWTLSFSDIRDNENNNPTIQNNTTTVEPPSSITASKGQYPDKIVLSWTKVNTAVAYGIFKKLASNSKYEFLTYSSDTNYTDTDVLNNTSYNYVVVTVIDNKNYSDPKQSPMAEGFTSNSQTSIPAKIEGLSANLSGSTVNLSWNLDSSSQVYQIARFSRKSNKWASIGTSKTNDYIDRSPESNTDNFYTVRGVSSAGGGAWSNATLASFDSNTPPNTPTLTVSNGSFSDKIEITWNSVSGAKVYFLFRYDYDSSKWSQVNQTSSTKYEDKDPSVINGKPFAYTIVAGNQSGNSSFATPIIGKTSISLVKRGMSIPAPKNLTSKIENGSVFLTWEKTKEAKEYFIFRSKKDDTKEVFIANIPSSQNSFSEKIQGDKEDLFFYTVRAKSELAESINSNQVVAFVAPSKLSKRSVGKSGSGEGFDKFSGTWTSSHWVSGTQKTPIVLVLKNKGANFTADFTYGKNPPITFTGNFADNSKYLITNNFKVEFIFDSAISLEVTAKNLKLENEVFGLTKD